MSNKAQILQYKRLSIVVKVEVENELKAINGLFIEKPKVENMPACWVFSAKRKTEVEKAAKRLGGTVRDYNPGTSIALIAPMAHTEKLQAAGGHFCQQLIDGANRFAGWVFAANKQDEVKALCATIF